METKQSAEEVIPEPKLDKATQRRLRLTVRKLLNTCEFIVLEAAGLYAPGGPTVSSRRRRIKSCSQNELLRVDYLLGKIVDGNFHSQLANRLYPVMMAAQNRVAAIAVERQRNRRKAADAERFFEARFTTATKRRHSQELHAQALMLAGYDKATAERYAHTIAKRGSMRLHRTVV